MTKHQTLAEAMLDPETMKAAALEAARFASFAQRVKMEYWKSLKSGEMTVPESTLDSILLLAWEDVKTHEYPL